MKRNSFRGIVCIRALLGSMALMLLTPCFYLGSGIGASHHQLSRITSSEPLSVRPATAEEQSIFATFAPAPFGWRLEMYAVAGSYALIGFEKQGSHIVGLACSVHWQWKLLELRSSDISPDEYAHYLPHIPLSLANELYRMGAAQRQSAS